MAANSSVPSASRSSESPPPNSSELPPSDGDSADSDGSDGPGRGRPEVKLDQSAERGLVRLLVQAPATSIDRLAKALKLHGGPGRLWLRKFYENVTGAGRLNDFRLKRGDALREEEDEDGTVDRRENWSGYVSLFASSETLERVRSSSIPHYDANTSSSALPVAAEQPSSPHRAMPQRKRNMPYLPVDATRVLPAMSSVMTEGFEQTTPPIVPESLHTDAFVSQENEARRISRGGQRAEVDANERIRPDEDGVQAQPRVDTQFTGQVPAERTPDGPKPGQASKNDRKRKLITSLTLTNMAKWLDGGKKGTHFRVAKERTVSFHRAATSSSQRMRTATSEFGLFYHRPTPVSNDSAGSGTSPMPLGMSVAHGPPTFRPEAVVVNCLIDAWKRSFEDDVVRDTLKNMLPERMDERKTFVNAVDGLGTSPLHLAVAYGYPHTCTFLLNHGANADAVTNMSTSIYDFAEPAESMAGGNIRLYYRILHCRTFVRVGQKPPAPKHPRYPEDEKRDRKKLKKGKAKGRSCHRKQVHVESTIPGIMTATTHANEPSTRATEEVQSWYAWPRTESPRSSTFHRNRSVPSKDQPSMITLNTLRRTTAAPPVPTLSFALPAHAGASNTLPNAVATTCSYDSSDTRSTSTAGPHDQWYGNRRMIHPAPKTQQPTHLVGYQTRNTIAPYSQPAVQGSSQWQRTILDSRPTHFADFDRSRLDLGPPAHPNENFTTGATDFAHGDFQHNRQDFHGSLSNTYRERYTQQPVSNTTTSYPAIAGYQQSYWRQPEPPFIPNPPRMPDGTVRQQPLPAVPVAAHYGNPALYQAPTTNSSQGAPEAPWFCLSDDPRCGIEYICRRCIIDYKLT